MLGGPPKDVPPSRLFLDLLATPYPIAPLGGSLAVAEGVPLYVRALPQHEAARVGLAEDDAALVVACLIDADAAPVFRNVEELGMLTDEEYQQVLAAVVSVLRRIAPSYDGSDVKAWHAALRVGAEAHAGIFLSMAGCYDGAGNRLIETPERYYGVPRASLTDGHWMAYRAAREAFETWRASQRKT